MTGAWKQEFTRLPNDLELPSTTMAASAHVDGVRRGQEHYRQQRLQSGSVSTTEPANLRRVVRLLLLPVAPESLRTLPG